MGDYQYNSDTTGLLVVRSNQADLAMVCQLPRLWGLSLLSQ
jgi:hypothetical protein